MARILLVEDEAILSMNIQMELEDMGHEVVGVARDSETAISLLETERPELVLVDIVLHGEMDGIELASLINRKYGTPIIYGTAHTDEATVRRANATKHFGIFFKPFRPYEMKEAIARALS
ncbi:MAG: response regulator [Gammaproteobacteria bacterium]|nr:response regulator [Gammaproteobacteria bacterium]